MTHFYEKNIVEIKNEYTTFLVNIMTPFLYEGLKSVYNYALDADNEFNKKAKNDPTIHSPGILKIFQTCLKEIPTLNNHSIENETNRIKDKSKCSDWFDDLVKAVIKSNIVLLTFSTNKDQSELVNDKFHDRIQTKDFVHKCLIESARAIYNNPELFWHEFPTIEIKRNQREICDLIKIAIKEAIRKMLPMKMILKEYLQNEYVKDTPQDISKNMNEAQYMNIRAMVNRDLHGKKLNDSMLVDDYDEQQFQKKSADINVPKHTYSNHGHESLIDDQDNGNDNAYEALNDDQYKKDDEMYKDLKNLNKELQEIENKLSENTKDKKEEDKKEEDKKEDRKLSDKHEDLNNDIFIKQGAGKKLDNEINYYLKKSDEANSSAKLKEIHTETRNNISDTDRSQFFAKYNV
jgi:hypothetical protein